MFKIYRGKKLVVRNNKKAASEKRIAALYYSKVFFMPQLQVQQVKNPWLPFVCMNYDAIWHFLLRL